MTGPKLNEGATVAGERAGTKATAKYVRSSASKAREVLDLIRGLPVAEAGEVLRFTERGAAEPIAKLLASAVANAEHNDDQDRGELYVSACYADEGPTLKRWRPRARGRATRIRKRTCHITIIVSRMTPQQLDQYRARTAAAAGRGAPQRDTSARRRARVARSRGEDAPATDESVDEAVDETAADEIPGEPTEETVEAAEEAAEDAEAGADVDDAEKTETEAEADETESSESEAAQAPAEAADDVEVDAEGGAAKSGDREEQQ